MSENDLRAVTALSELVILDATDPTAASISNPCLACDIAEADNTVRLFELLHRGEYRPLCGVRMGTGEQSRIRVYFRRIHTSARSGSPLSHDAEPK